MDLLVSSKETIRSGTPLSIQQVIQIVRSSVSYILQRIIADFSIAALAEYLVLRGEMLSPQLLLRIKANNNSSALAVNFNGGVEMPAGKP